MHVRLDGLGALALQLRGHGGQQHQHQVLEALLCRHAQRLALAGKHVGAVLEGNLAASELADRGRLDQGAVLGRVHVRAGGQQQLHRVAVAVAGRDAQRGVGGVVHGRAVRQQQLAELPIAILGRLPQCATCESRGVRPGLQQVDAAGYAVASGRTGQGAVPGPGDHRLRHLCA